MKNKLPYCNVQFVLQTKYKISNFFTFKDKIPSVLRSGIVYKFQCSSCSATYYGKTKRHFKVRMCEHLGISALTGKRVKGDDDSAIKQHLLFCNHTTDFEDFSILATNNNNFKVTLTESLLINRDHPRGGSRTAATFKMECFVIIVNGLKPLTIITKHSIFDVAAVLDPPLHPPLNKSKQSLERFDS